ncbi:MAG: hypothetical protein PHI06_09060 [Desulfobulbaceae bacterium]|nr:hypothetical protein [Desulfobulbaceae bacterium]
MHVLHKSYRITFALFLIMVFMAPAFLSAAESISPEAAKAHLGETRTICGKVANTYYSRFVTEKPTFINFGKPYPNHVFSIAIMGENRNKYENAPEDFFEGKSLCVTGLIEIYDNKPLIVVRDKTQIHLQE